MVVSALVTEIIMVGGERLRVEGATDDVEAVILSAARGSILEFAWLTEADSGQRVGISPDQVLMLRGLDPESDVGGGFASDGG
jgi:hypothetical protein